MPAIKLSDWQQACLGLAVDWPGIANDGRTLAQRLDALEQRVAALEAQLAAIAGGASNEALALRVHAIEQLLSGGGRLWSA